MGNDLRLDAKNVGKMLDALFERFVGFGIFHIADMMAEERIMVACQTKGILQFAAHGQRGFHFERKFDRIWSITTRTRR